MTRSHFGVARQVLAIALALTPGSLDAQERLVAIDSVGSAEGDDAFGQIVNVAVSAKGRLAVTQYGVGEVWVFDPEGNRQVFGQSGDGPGDLGFAPAVSWQGDTLVVVEGYRQRVSLMAGEGRYVGGLTTRSVAVTGHAPVGYLRSGLTLAAPEISSRSTAAAKPLLLVDAGDQIVDSVGEVRQSRVTAEVALPTGKIDMFRHPMPSRTRTAVSPDGRYFATADELEGSDGSELRFVLYDDVGDELGRATASVVTDRLSDEDLLDRLGEYVESLSREYSRAHARKLVLDAFERPDRWPALSGFRLDNAGRFWVGSRRSEGGSLWRAWTVEGHLVRTWIMEPGLRMRQVMDGGAVVTRSDDVRGPRVIYMRPQT